MLIAKDTEGQSGHSLNFIQQGTFILYSSFFPPSHLKRSLIKNFSFIISSNHTKHKYGGKFNHVNSKLNSLFPDLKAILATANSHEDIWSDLLKWSNISSSHFSYTHIHKNTHIF